MGTVVAKIKDYVSGPVSIITSEEDVRQQVEFEHQAENRRLVHDPDVMGDTSIQALRRVSKITFDELDRLHEVAETRLREIRMDIDNLKLVVEDKVAPLAQEIANVLESLTPVHDAVKRFKSG